MARQAITTEAPMIADRKPIWIVASFRIFLLAGLWIAVSFGAAVVAGDEPARGPVTLHVSKLGNDSNGLTWQTAFRSIQKALDSIPDQRGGHKIIVRPDTYVEANLAPG